MNLSQILSWEIAKIANLLCNHNHSYKNINDCINCIHEKIKELKIEKKECGDFKKNEQGNN